MMCKGRSGAGAVIGPEVGYNRSTGRSEPKIPFTYSLYITRYTIPLRLKV